MTADRQIAGGDTAVPQAKVERLKDKIAKLNEEVARLNAINKDLQRSQDGQISLVDPDSRSTATSGKDTGIVGYIAQAAVDTQHHLIVAHEVTNVGTDIHRRADMAKKARTELGSETLEVVAERGYYEGFEIEACEDAGISVSLPRRQTSGAKAESFRQAGLRLQAGGKRLSLSCRRDAAILLHERSRRQDRAPLSDPRMSRLSDQVALHAINGATYHPLGALSLHDAAEGGDRNGAQRTRR